MCCDCEQNSSMTPVKQMESPSSQVPSQDGSKKAWPTLSQRLLSWLLKSQPHLWQLGKEPIGGTWIVLFFRGERAHNLKSTEKGRD